MEQIWLPEARADVQRLFDFLIETSPSTAAAALRAIRGGAARLAEHPWIGRRMDDETERRELVLPFGAGAYVVRYRIEHETVVILRVWHGREDRR
jgi:plasmid stabilization system protein ParE